MVSDTQSEKQEALNNHLILAANEGDVPAIQQALRDGAELEARHANGWNVLDRAAMNGHLDAITALLEAGAKIDEKNGMLSTALHTASGTTNNHDAIKALLEAGAEVNAPDAKLDTPLHDAVLVAMNSCDIDSIKLLLAAGANPALKNDRNETPVDGMRDRIKDMADRLQSKVGIVKQSAGMSAMTTWIKNFKDFAEYLQSIVDDPAKRPTPESTGLDMHKRIAALEALGKPLGEFTHAERRRKAQRETREAQRQEALRGGGI